MFLVEYLSQTAQIFLIFTAKATHIITWQFIIGERLSTSSTCTKFFRDLGEKKKVSPSSNGVLLLNLGSSSSSPNCAIWYRKLKLNSFQIKYTGLIGCCQKEQYEYWGPLHMINKKPICYSTWPGFIITFLIRFLGCVVQRTTP